MKFTVKENQIINDLRLKVLEHLNKSNDGNKIYTIRAFSLSADDAVPIPLNRLITSFFENSSDVFCLLDVNVDLKKHVKPIEVKKPVATAAAGKAPVTLASDDKFVSLAKYSYYESGKKWVKVLLDFKDIKNHPADKVTVEFKPRSFTVRVLEFKGQNYQFQVPKTQCAVVPEECSHTIKSDSIQITLRKAKDDDNWWSLFRTKAVGEVLSD